MGLFMSRPEDPTEWGGLPAEPGVPEAAAEHLSDAVPTGLGLGGLFGTTSADVTSVTIPAVADADAADPDADAAIER